MNKSTKVLWGLIIVLLIIAVVVIANVISLLPKENTSSINEELLIPDTETNLQGNNSVVENEEGKTFRNTYWGMTIDQVKNKETAQFLYEKNNIILYEETIMGYKSTVSYMFANKDVLLNRAAYTFEIEHTNDNLYIDDYTYVKKELEKKYGKETEERKIWKNNTYKDFPAGEGMAIALGHLVLFTRWETDDTDICVMLDGDNYESSLEITYWSKEYENDNTEKNKDKL